MAEHPALDVGASRHGERSPSPWPEKNDVLVVETEFIDDANDITITNKRPTVLDSIGVARLLILGIGSVAITAAAIILALLWQGAAIAIGLGDPSRTWRSVVERGWAPVTITVCAAAIRTAMSLQAGVAMSMVAAVLLERRHVKLGDSVFLSIIRAVSVQPVGLLFSGGRGVLKSLGVLGMPLLVVTSLIAITSTFTSSILLGDFGTITMLGNFNTSVIGYGYDGMASLMDVWRLPPVQFARFAEYTDDTGRIMGQPYIEDTGVTFRTPLPMAAKSQRDTLRQYVGPATVFDQRVICVAPKTLTIESLNFTDTIGLYTLTFGGHVTFDTNLPLPIMGADSGEQMAFQCMTPDNTATTICMVVFNNTSEGTPSPLRMAGSLPLSRPELHNYGGFPRPVFLIFNVTAPSRPTGWMDFLQDYFHINNGTRNSGGVVVPQDGAVLTRKGPWATTTINGIERLEGVSFSGSACIMGLNGYPFNVTLKAESDAHEPVLGWTGTLRATGGPPKTDPEPEPNNAQEQKYDTSNVLRQLNALGPGPSGTLTSQQRGVMELDFFATNWTKVLGGDDKSDGILMEMSIFLLTGIFPKFQLANACEWPGDGCFTDPESVVTASGALDTFGHPAHVALFHDAMFNTGGSPARALQSWLTTLTWQLYYDSQARFTMGAEARYVHSVQVFAPWQQAGFLGVMVMLVCHVLVVSGVTAWYLCVTRYTMLGNSWQAVSQVVSEETLPLIRRASGLKDSEVKGIIRRERNKADRYMIARSRKTRRSELMAMSWEGKTVVSRKGK